MKIYIVVIEDRHIDTDCFPFSTANSAIDFAKTAALKYCRYQDDYEESLNDEMKNDGWIWHATYSCEGDNVRVIERELQD